MNELARIRRAQSQASDPADAVRELHASMAQDDMALVIFFCSADYDLEIIATEMRRLFAGVQVVGCTTAGEIGPAGCVDRSISGASFPRASFRVASGRMGQLQRFDAERGHRFAQSLLQQLEGRAPSADENNTFGLLLIDGMSIREESVTQSLQGALGRLSMVGGSAGDGLRFGRTYVYFDGAFHPDSAVLSLVTTHLRFKLFKTQHLVATDRRLVVTAADTGARSVKEINGLPASEEYARIVGIDPADLDPARFAAWPVVVVIDGVNYVRAIQKANPDGSLTFFCAIEEGLVLRVATGTDLPESVERAFKEIRDEIGPPQLVIGCDCVLRKLEAISSPGAGRIAEVLVQNNTVGFNTYGEQFRGVHVNQTLVGIAIGERVRVLADA